MNTRILTAAHTTRGEATQALAGTEDLRWLRRIRWAALAGHIAVFLLAVFALKIELPIAPLLIVQAVLGLSNSLLYARPVIGVAQRQSFLGALLVLDVVLFTYLLSSYGGFSNPFSAVYLVHVVVAALILPSRGTWFVALCTCIGYSLLFFRYTPIAGMHSHGHDFDLHLQGMLCSYFLLAALIAGFVSRMRAAIDRQRAQLQELRANEERLLSLTTLAGGAAHELGTPLNTISLIAGELCQNAATLSATALTDELRLLESQVTRCAEILRGMNPKTGTVLGEAPVEVSFHELTNEASNLLPTDLSKRLRVSRDEDCNSANLPRRAVIQALSLLLKNAFDAGKPSDTVSLRISSDKAFWRFQIEDSGCGMNESELRRLGEPFFTTKQPGTGTGLGVFVCRTLITRLGGMLQYDSARGRGTLASLLIPKVITWQSNYRSIS